MKKRDFSYNIVQKRDLEPDGNFTYTPGTDKKGRDYFGYKVADSEGNLSQEATVIIKIEKSR